MRNINEIKKCIHCQSDIDKKAKICPICRKSQIAVWRKIIAIPLFIIAFICFISALTSIVNFGETVPVSTGTAQTQFTLLDDGYKGYYDDYKVNYYVEGTIQNNTNKEYSYVQVEFNLYDKNNILLGTAVANVNNLEANGKWKFKAIGLNSSDDSVVSYKLKDITGY